jgi:hypothetical protein
MPQSPTMVMLYGKGGHLSTDEYSIVLVREADGTWRGTAVGRRQIWVQNAPYTPMKRIEWSLDKDAARRLDGAIAHRCPSDHKAATPPAGSGVPSRGIMTERMDVITPGHVSSTFYAEEGGSKIASLIRPPE